MKHVRDKEKYNAYMREYNLKRYYRLKREAAEKLGGQCVNCRSEKNLQFDHRVRTEKSFNVSAMLRYSLKRFWEEVDKCQLLCMSCHRLKTTIEAGKKIGRGNHGTLSSYRYCKCDKCKKAKNDWSRAYRARVGHAKKLG